MTLFYLTNTLNIDNILTSECLIPMSLYPSRGFGYNSFEPAPFRYGDSLSNSILLFRDLPYFHIESSEVECEPMVIEISDSALDGRITDISAQQDGSIYAVNDSRPVFLSPWNCRVLYPTMRAYEMARLKCQDSKCNKWWEFYKMDFYKPANRVSLEQLTYSIAAERIPSPELTAEKENLRNRAKGLAYGFVVGYMKSVAPEVAKIRALQKQIYNDVATIINTGGIPNTTFTERIKKADDEFQNQDPYMQLAREKWAALLAQHDLKPEQLGFLKDYGLNAVLYNFLEKEAIPYRSLRYDGAALFNWAEYQQSLSDYTSAIVRSCQRKNAEELDVTRIFAKTEAGLSLYTNTDAQETFDGIIHDLLLNKGTLWKIEDISVQRVNIFKAFVGYYRKELGDAFNTSEECSYLKSLSACFLQDEPFNPLTSDNVILQSVAAFVLKGSSYEELLTYMTEKGYTNFEYAMAMWGACVGYTDISRSIVRSISSDKVLLCRIYKAVANLTDDLIAVGEFSEQTVHTISNVGGKISQEHSDFKERLQADERFNQFSETAKNKIYEAVDIEAKQQNKEAFVRILNTILPSTNEIVTKIKRDLADRRDYTKAEFEQAVIDICRSVNCYKTNSTVRNRKWKGRPFSYQEAVKLALTLEDRIGDRDAIMFIIDDSYDSDTEEYKTLMDILCPEGVSITEKTSPLRRIVAPITNAVEKFLGRESEGELPFPEEEQHQVNKVASQNSVGERNLRPINPTSSKFVEDDNVGYFILSINYLPIQMRETLSKKVITFQKGYAPGGRYYSNPLDNPVDNRSTIDHFKHWCFYDRGGYPPIVVGTSENKQYFEQLTQDLLNRYADR